MSTTGERVGGGAACSYVTRYLAGSVGSVAAVGSLSVYRFNAIDSKRVWQQESPRLGDGATKPRTQLTPRTLSP